MTGCIEVRRLHKRGFADSLTLEEEFLIEEHLAVCSDCAELLGRERQFDRLFATLPGAPIERLDLARSAAAIWTGIDGGPARNTEGSTLDDFGATGWGRRRTAVAAAVLLMAVGFGLWRVLDPQRSVDLAAVPGPAATEPLVVEAASVAPEAFPSLEFDPVQVSGEDARVPGQVLVEGRERAPIQGEFRGPARLESTDLDRERLDKARALVRAQLLSAAESLAVSTPHAQVVEGIGRIESGVESTLGAWPVVRIIESLVLDADLQVARGALRYLGVRGDASSARVVERALRDGELAAAAVEALCDLGPSGFRGLSWAYWNTPFDARVLQQMTPLARDEPRKVAACLDWIRDTTDALGRSAPGGRGRPLLDLLGRVEDIGAGEFSATNVEFLFELAADSDWRPVALDAWSARPDAEQTLLRLLADQDGATSEALLLDAIESLGCVAALPWLDETCRRGEARARALSVLAHLEGAQVVERLIGLRRNFPAAHFEAEWSAALGLQPESFATYAGRLVALGGRAELKVYLDLLLATGDARAVPAICVLGGSRALADDDRERALLIVGDLAAIAAGLDETATIAELDVGVPHTAYVDALRETFESLEHDDQDLAAACLWSARRMGALREDTSAQTWLAASTEAKRQRVVELLGAVHPRGNGALRRFQLARELESELSIRAGSDRSARNSRTNSIGGMTP